MHAFTHKILSALPAIADHERAAGVKAYMKNQFEFLGTPTPERRKFFRVFAKQQPSLTIEELDKVVKELWLLPEREYQYCAIELLLYYNKLWQQQTIDLFQYCITNKSWWDTVDFICTTLVAPFFKRYPEMLLPITTHWNTSSNIWLQRSSLLAQKGYKHDTNIQLLVGHIINLSTSKAFFVQKAIGWILRDHARIDPAWVKQFVAENNLPALSKREALKHLLHFNAL